MNDIVCRWCTDDLRVICGHSAEAARTVHRRGDGMSERRGEKAQLVQAVERSDEMWAATCDHGDEIWYLERGTERNAWRSLRAHARWEHADLRPASEWPDANLPPERPTTPPAQPDGEASA